VLFFSGFDWAGIGGICESVIEIPVAGEDIFFAQSGFRPIYCVIVSESFIEDFGIQRFVEFVVFIEIILVFFNHNFRYCWRMFDLGDIYSIFRRIYQPFFVLCNICARMGKELISCCL